MGTRGSASAAAVPQVTTVRITYRSWDYVEPPTVAAVGQPNPMIEAVEWFCQRYATDLEELAKGPEA